MVREYNAKGAGDLKIYEALTTTDLLANHCQKFIKDVNISMKMYADCMIIVDLSNALKVGKTCTNYKIRAGEHDWEHSFKSNFEVALMKHKITFEEFVRTLLLEQGNFEDIRIMKSQSKGVSTFSPFAEIKPIKEPKKWTVPHVWKAILAGQIKMAVKEMRLTDSSIGDVEDNFGRGDICPLHLAKRLIESPSGWWVRDEERAGDSVWLSVNKDQYDYNKLRFEVNKEVKADCIEIAG